jgi:phosphoenolpyruvate carboxykinase (ATP)
MAAPIRPPGQGAGLHRIAWHSLFIRNLLIRPDASRTRLLRARDDDRRPAELQGRPGPPWLPQRDGDRRRFHPQDRADRRHLLCRRDEEVGVHLCSTSSAAAARASCRCTARPMSAATATSAVFFGLSGTGKTTLSADPDRTLIGDDEHGWGEGRRLQLRGRLLRQDDQALGEAEPEIYATSKRFGTVLENVVIDPVTREVPISTTARRPRTPAPPIRSTSSPTPRARAAPARRRTS